MPPFISSVASMSVAVSVSIDSDSVTPKTALKGRLAMTDSVKSSVPTPSQRSTWFFQ